MMINDGEVDACWRTKKDRLTHLFLPRFHNRNDGTIHITKEKPTQRLESRAVCEQINKQTANETIMVVEQTTGWYVTNIIFFPSLFISLLGLFIYLYSDFFLVCICKEESNSKSYKWNVLHCYMHCSLLWNSSLSLAVALQSHGSV